MGDPHIINIYIANGEMEWLIQDLENSLSSHCDTSILEDHTASDEESDKYRTAEFVVHHQAINYSCNECKLSSSV
jgi:hypothetical protein